MHAPALPIESFDGCSVGDFFNAFWRVELTDDVLYYPPPKAQAAPTLEELRAATDPNRIENTGVRRLGHAASEWQHLIDRHNGLFFDYTGIRVCDDEEAFTSQTARAKLTLLHYYGRTFIWQPFVQRFRDGVVVATGRLSNFGAVPAVITPSLFRSPVKFDLVHSKIIEDCERGAVWVDVKIYSPAQLPAAGLACAAAAPATDTIEQATHPGVSRQQTEAPALRLENAHHAITDMLLVKAADVDSATGDRFPVDRTELFDAIRAAAKITDVSDVDVEDYLHNNHRRPYEYWLSVWRARNMGDIEPNFRNPKPAAGGVDWFFKKQPGKKTKWNWPAIKNSLILEINAAGERPCSFKAVIDLVLADGARNDMDDENTIRDHFKKYCNLFYKAATKRISAPERAAHH